MGSKSISPFLVDQKGGFWFWLALIICFGGGVSFRLYFSESRVENEIRFAFEKIKSEIELNFDGARLTLSDGFITPLVAIEISGLRGKLYPLSDGRSIPFFVDKVRVPIKLIEIITGQFSLSQIHLGHINLEISFDQIQKLGLDAVKSSSLVSEAPSKKDPSVQSKPESQVIKSFLKANSVRPVNRVTFESLRFESEQNKGLHLFELRYASFSIQPNGFSDLSAQLFFRHEDWGGVSPEAQLSLQWRPDDLFLQTKIYGRLNEGVFNFSGSFDFLQKFMNLEGSFKYLPLTEVIGFLKSSSYFFSLFDRPFDWERIGWLSSELSIYGSLLPQRPSQIILRNIQYEGTLGQIKVPSLSWSGMWSDLKLGGGGQAQLKHFNLEELTRRGGLEVLNANHFIKSIKGQSEGVFEWDDLMVWNLSLLPTKQDQWDFSFSHIDLLSVTQGKFEISKDQVHIKAEQAKASGYNINQFDLTIGLKPRGVMAVGSDVQTDLVAESAELKWLQDFGFSTNEKLSQEIVEGYGVEKNKEIINLKINNIKIKSLSHISLKNTQIEFNFKLDDIQNGKSKHNQFMFKAEVDDNLMFLDKIQGYWTIDFQGKKSKIKGWIKIPTTQAN